MTTTQARAVLVLRDLRSPAWEVRAFSHALRERGLRVFAPGLHDFRPPPSGPIDEGANADFRGWIAEATEHVDGLAATHGGVALCGVGLGTALALAVAAERPSSLLGLSLISTTLFFDGPSVARWAMLPIARFASLGRWYGQRYLPPYSVKSEPARLWIAGQYAQGLDAPAGVARIPVPCLREAHRLIRHVRSCLVRVRTPTLLIHSREDELASLANVRHVRSHIGSTMIGAVVVERSYHRITLDGDCELAALKTAQFLNAAARELKPTTHPAALPDDGPVSAPRTSPA